MVVRRSGGDHGGEGGMLYLGIRAKLHSEVIV